MERPSWDEYFIEITRLVAKRSTCLRRQVGAVIVKDGKIVGRGYNHVRAHNDPTAHAEVMAIRDACNNLEIFDLTGCELYTSCEPCPMCL